MSHSRENTIFTQFSVSSDSVAVDDSLLISGFIEDMTNSRMSLQKENSDLQLEMELINEDRHRLQKENQELKAKLEKTHLKTVQIELLSKIATKALELNYTNRFTVLSQSPMRKINCKIKIKSPSQGSPCRVLNSFFIPTPGNLATDISSASSSPLKSNRTTSSKIRVSRNYLKYPK